MNCKHCNEKEYCTLFNKNVNEVNCKNCVMKIARVNKEDLINQIFSHFKNKGE